VNRFLLFLIVFSFCLGISKGQEQLGLSQENHAGINAIWINPANSFLTPHPWDINIISAGVFFDNNYGYLKNTNSYRLYKKRKSLSFEFDSLKTGGGFLSAETVYLDFYKSKKVSSVALSGKLNGPSFTIKIDKNSSIGFVSAFRAIANIQKIPKELSFYTYFNKPFYRSFPISSFKAGYLSWQEYGLNYVKRVKGYSTNTLIGITVKYLAGNEAGFFDNKKTFLLQQMPNDSIAIIGKANLQYGITTRSFNANHFLLKQNGVGVSVDLGTTIIFGENLKDQKFRIGVSLLDIGFIKFNKNALEYKIDIDTLAIFDINDYKGINQLSQIDSINKILSKQALNNPEESFVANSFSVWLPFALSLQFDYSFSQWLHLNTTLIQRITSKSHAVARDNIFAITPRIEHRWFSVSVPFVIYNWRDFRIGTSIRLAYLTLGSDNILSVFSSQTHYTGSDIYIGLKFNPFWEKKTNKHKRKSIRKIKCYEF